MASAYTALLVLSGLTLFIVWQTRKLEPDAEEHGNELDVGMLLFAGSLVVLLVFFFAPLFAQLRCSEPLAADGTCTGDPTYGGPLGMLMLLVPPLLAGGFLLLARQRDAARRLARLQGEDDPSVMETVEDGPPRDRRSISGFIVVQRDEDEDTSKDEGETANGDDTPEDDDTSKENDKDTSKDEATSKNEDTSKDQAKDAPKSEPQPESEPQPQPDAPTRSELESRLQPGDARVQDTIVRGDDALQAVAAVLRDIDGPVAFVFSGRVSGDVNKALLAIDDRGPCEVRRFLGQGGDSSDEAETIAGSSAGHGAELALELAGRALPGVLFVEEGEPYPDLVLEAMRQNKSVVLAEASNPLTQAAHIAVRVDSDNADSEASRTTLLERLAQLLAP